MIFLKKLQILVLTLLFLLISNFAFAQTVTPTPAIPSATSTIPDCANNHISVADCPVYIQDKINVEQGKENTYKNQIAVKTNAIYLAQAQIDATEEQITNLTLDIDTATKKVSGLEKSLNSLVDVLLNRMVATYEIGTIQPLQILLTSTDASDFLSRLNYLKRAQAHDKQLVYETQQAKTDYANQKTIYEDKKKTIEASKLQLEAYTQQLNQEKRVLQDFLAQTQGSEANYQRLLAQAKAQIAGFQRFVTSQGGASILSGQTSCDDWGCYYNQRDSQWGSNSLNGTQYTLASDGCLVTSMAMVYTHLGHRGVTPATINSNPSNFASYYPAYLNKTISADGMTTSRIASSIDSELSAGRPVIIGIGSGPDHFIVLVSGSGGNYIMNDPFVPNGHNINFTDHYSLSNIKTIEKISN